ncbi:MAG TPA: PPC domain-containing DNA-binding protein [Thermomicrobiales bacterium]|nr:PPC domain-containing DNA-binding protein [Thermomicrobiales bacterium]
MMKSTLLQEQGGRIFAVVFDKGDEVIAGLTDFAKQQGCDSSEFTAIGAFSGATLGYFDRERRDYRQIPIEEQVEVLSLVGNITLSDGKPKIHAHVVVGRSDGTTRGGHILEAHVWPTLEVVVTETPARLRRQHDPETGLALLAAE